MGNRLHWPVGPHSDNLLPVAIWQNIRKQEHFHISLRSAIGDDATPLRYRTDRDSEAELLDYDLAEDERVYGVARVASASASAAPTRPLFALKYRRAVSLVDVEGDMKGNWKSKVM